MVVALVCLVCPIMMPVSSLANLVRYPSAAFSAMERSAPSANASSSIVSPPALPSSSTNNRKIEIVKGCRVLPAGAWSVPAPLKLTPMGTHPLQGLFMLPLQVRKRFLSSRYQVACGAGSRQKRLFTMDGHGSVTEILHVDDVRQ